MAMVQPISEDDLHAYVDGELIPERRRQVESYLAQHPEAADRIRDFGAQNRALHALYDSVLEEPIPLGMAQRKATPWREWAPRLAAAIVLLVVGAAGGWWANGTIGWDSAQPTNIVARAAVAHAVYSTDDRPVEIEAADQEHLVSWLSKRLGVQLRTPNLSEAGYNLVGGRLVPGSSAPAAYFMYENAEANRITLYVRVRYPKEKKTAFQYGYHGEVGVLYWMDDRLGYAVAGQMTREELLKIATAVQGDTAGS